MLNLLLMDQHNVITRKKLLPIHLPFFQRIQNKMQSPPIINLPSDNTAVSARALGNALSQHVNTKDSYRECNSKYMLNIKLKQVTALYKFKNANREI